MSKQSQGSKVFCKTDHYDETSGLPVKHCACDNIFHMCSDCGDSKCITNIDCQKYTCEFNPKYKSILQSMAIMIVIILIFGLILMIIQRHYQN